MEVKLRLTKMQVINPWKNFLDSLDTPGGHVFLLCIAVPGMMIAHHYGLATQGEVGLFSGALLVALKGTIRNNGTKTPPPANPS